VCCFSFWIASPCLFSKNQPLLEALGSPSSRQSATDFREGGRTWLLHDGQQSVAWVHNTTHLYSGAVRPKTMLSAQSSGLRMKGARACIGRRMYQGSAEKMLVLTGPGSAWRKATLGDRRDSSYSRHRKHLLGGPQTVES
jgi:hypothetical protein